MECEAIFWFTGDITFIHFPLGSYLSIRTDFFISYELLFQSPLCFWTEFHFDRFYIYKGKKFFLVGHKNSRQLIFVCI